LIEHSHELSISQNTGQPLPAPMSSQAAVEDDPLDLIEGHVNQPAIIELRSASADVVCHERCVLGRVAKLLNTVIHAARTGGDVGHQ
jgi:hypothetical protein